MNGSRRPFVTGARACRRARRRLQSYLDGDLDATTADAVARHVASCARCDLEMRTYAAVKAALSRTRAARSVEHGAAMDRLRRFAQDLAHGRESGRGYH